MNLQPDQIEEFLKRRTRKELARPGLIHAGVLILLFHKNDELHVLLTKRSSDVEHHRGQISFPGGAVDDLDTDIVATAVRETEEEVGIRATAIRVLGLFDDAWTPSGFRITPVIGYIDGSPDVRPNPLEVEEVLEVALSFFVNSQNERVKQVTHGEAIVDVYFYTYGTNEIWGATAGMLRSLVHALHVIRK
ncbi:MAG: CoA pyrophosphatase [Bacteroidota bacterium]